MPKGEHLKGGANMATRFSAERQPDKYRQPDSITALIKRELFSNDGWAVLEGAEIMDEEGNPTGKKVTVRVKLTTAEAAAKRILQRAMKNSDRLMEQIWERIDGKVPQDFNMGGKDGAAIQVELNFENLSTDELKTFIALTEKAEQTNE